MNKIKLTTYFIWCLWLLVVIIGCVHSYTHHASLTLVSSVYYQAGAAWLHQQPLYNGLGTQFIYLPPSAAFYMPLSVLPFQLAEFVWRIIAILFFALSLVKFSALAESNNGFNAKIIFIIVSLFTIPLSITIAEDGQMHLFIMGLLCFAATAIVRAKWWQAAFLLAVAVAFKPTALVIYLLFALLYPKLWLRIIAATLIVFALPFVLQNPHYAWSQYHAFLTNFTMISQMQGSKPQDWVQLFTVIKLLTHYQFSAFTQTLIRLVFAGFTLALCFICKQKFPNKTAVIYIFAFGIIYLMLFNARTENNDYVMLMPFIGLAFVQALQLQQKLVSVYLLLIAVFIGFNHLFSKLISPGNDHWLKPGMCILFAVFLGWQLLVSRQRTVYKLA